MALEPDSGLAERLAHMMRKAGEEALLELGEELKRQVIEGSPLRTQRLTRILTISCATTLRCAYSATSYPSAWRARTP
jgi:hypothetical protein